MERLSAQPSASDESPIGKARRHSPRSLRWTVSEVQPGMRVIRAGEKAGTLSC
jgi:hypothetical protein